MDRGGWWKWRQIASMLRDVRADGWDECAREAHDLGWMHEDALMDVLSRNPYRRL